VGLHKAEVVVVAVLAVAVVPAVVGVVVARLSAVHH